MANNIDVLNILINIGFWMGIIIAVLASIASLVEALTFAHSEMNISLGLAGLGLTLCSAAGKQIVEISSLTPNSCIALIIGCGVIIVAGLLMP